MARLVALPLLLLLLWPQPAAAQVVSPEPPPAPPTEWAMLPDLLPYAPRFIVPQCGDCNGPTTIELAPKPPPAVVWTDPGSPFNWLAWAIEDIIQRLICWILFGLQALANVLQLFANALIYAINQGWKFAIFTWLTLKSVFYNLWYFVELTRDMWRQFEQLAVLIGAWLQVLGMLLVRALVLAGEMAMLLLTLALQLLGLLGWFGGLALGFIGAIGAALQGSTPPAVLESDNSPVYAILRGFGAGFRDSPLGWLLYLVWGMAYVAFFVWLAKFLPASRSESE